MTLNWEISSNLSNVSTYEFDINWETVYGSFELRIDECSLGFVMDRSLSPDEDYFDILYKIESLLKALVNAQNNKKTIIPLLTLCLTEINIRKKGAYIIVCYQYHKGNKKIWEKKIDYSDFFSCIINSVDKLISQIGEMNPDLLLTKRITKLNALKEVAVSKNNPL